MRESHGETVYHGICDIELIVIKAWVQECSGAHQNRNDTAGYPSTTRIIEHWDRLQWL